MKTIHFISLTIQINILGMLLTDDKYIKLILFIATLGYIWFFFKFAELERKK